MVDNLLDEFDGRLLRVQLAYPFIAQEVQKIKKHTAYVIKNDKDPRGRPLNKEKILRSTVKSTLEMVKKHPELKEYVKPIVVKAVNYLEPQHASADKH